MPESSVELQLGKVLGAQEMILNALSDANGQRDTQNKAIQHISGIAEKLDDRMAKVETKLERFEPTIEEFLSIKRRVAGAGKLGRWLWVVAIFIVTALYKLRVEMLGWPK